jgi:4-amino-4-deoxy-L-arabinose transferase-like glycosyltransferase
VPGIGEAGARRIRPDTYAFFFVSFAAVVILIHLPYLGLPYHWDEMGQFVPAALDILRHGQWVPHSTVPNVHPPGVMAYLASFWAVFGVSIEATRVAMLLAAAFSVLVSFLLAIRLCEKTGGAPAFLAVLLLIASPVFYTQAMMAQLDMPAMLFTAWALLLFLDGRFRAAALASVALVLVKETGLAVPLVLGAWLWREGRRREALWYALPAVALAAWLVVLDRSTGHVLGNSEFTDYNLTFPLHPVRLAIALFRRAFYLFVADFHWIGWIAVAVAARRSDLFRTRSWRVAGTVAAANVLAVTVLGGATLERYLLPALPVMYAAMAAAWSTLRGGWARAGQAAMIAGMVAALFWRPPYPQPYENNLAMVDFVRLQQKAAAFLERNCASRTITTAWPLAPALRRPDYGYVRRPLKVKRVMGFNPPALAALDGASVDVLVLYSSDWQGPADPRRAPLLAGLMRRLYHYEPQSSPEQVAGRLHLTRVARWERGGEWAEVMVRR